MVINLLNRFDKNKFLKMKKKNKINLDNILSSRIIQIEVM